MLAETKCALAVRDNLQDAPIVDVDGLYNEYVNEKIKAHRQSIGVDALQLKEFEINLRKYRIINGVFALEYLEQPEQDTKLQANFFLRTRERDERMLGTEC